MLMFFCVKTDFILEMLLEIHSRGFGEWDQQQTDPEMLED